MGILPGIPNDGHKGGRVPPTTWDREAALKLWDAVHKYDNSLKVVNITNWAHEFRQLRGIQEKAHIKKVLRWYTRNIGKPYVPHAFSGSGFRTKFLYIEAAMERATELVPTNYYKEVEEIYQQLKLWLPPPAKDEDMRGLIARTLSNYTNFSMQLHAAKCEHYKVTDHNGHRLYMLLLYITEMMYPPTAFTREWVSQAHRVIWNGHVSGWLDWQGRTTGWAMTYRHVEFAKVGREWCNDYCGDPDRWPAVLDIIMGAKCAGPDEARR